MRFHDLKISHQLYSLNVIFLISMMLIVLYVMSHYHDGLMEDRKAKTENIVSVAHSLVEKYVSAYKAGEMSLEEAQNMAKESVAAMRYDGDNYYWINDMQPAMVIHPIKPQLNGKDLSGVKDTNGKVLFVEFVKVVKENGEGFVPYMWEKPGSEEPVSKMSFVKAVPEWGWIIGSGIYIDDVEAVYYEGLKKFFLITFLIIAVGLVITWGIVAGIVKPIYRVEGAINELCEDKSIFVGDDGRKDEIGGIARALVKLNRRLEAARLFEAEQRELKARTEGQKAELLEKLANDFDQNVGRAISSLTTSASDLQNSAGAMKGLAESAVESTAQVASNSEQASASVGSVASAVEEMSASIREISAQVTAARTKMNDTTASATSANEKVSNLNSLVENIGEVVVAISDIAEQTNLLALNATIEAARAGEAGKGFAVVAEEVKKLASETGNKTGEINERITEIQLATKDSVEAMQSIIASVSDINVAVTGISAAIEEQSATTQEISRSISEATQGVRSVSDIITQVKIGASNTGDSAEIVLVASNEMAKLSDSLETSVKSFLSEIKSAGKKEAA